MGPHGWISEPFGVRFDHSSVKPVGWMSPLFDHGSIGWMSPLCWKRLHGSMSLAPKRRLHTAVFLGEAREPGEAREDVGRVREEEGPVGRGRVEESLDVMLDRGREQRANRPAAFGRPQSSELARTRIIIIKPKAMLVKERGGGKERGGILERRAIKKQRRRAGAGGAKNSGASQPHERKASEPEVHDKEPGGGATEATGRRRRRLPQAGPVCPR